MNSAALNSIRRSLIGALLLFALTIRWAPLAAQDFGLNGFVDGRVVAPSDQRSWMEGGLGKTRFGDPGGASPSLRFDEAVVDARAQLSPALLAFATLRSAPDQRIAVDILEAYLRYRPTTAGPLAWSLKLGAFFPPISLENEGVGWSSPWTLTPSAINSWVGDELRTNGAEARIEWRRAAGSAELTLAVFGWNDPAGVLIADRGWALGDRPTGLFDKPRVPDAIAALRRLPVPLRINEFKNIDNRPGWYAGLSLREDGIGRINLLRYDNNADPAASRDGQIAWRTSFTSAGLESDIGDFVLLGQAMAGETEIAPLPSFREVTRFQSGYLLLGRYFGDWSVAGRAELFATQEERPARAPDFGEHGRAATVAVNWRPDRHVRLTAELVEIASFRVQRRLAGLAPEAEETQLQMSARFLF